MKRISYATLVFIVLAGCGGGAESPLESPVQTESAPASTQDPQLVNTPALVVRQAGIQTSNKNVVSKQVVNATGRFQSPLSGSTQSRPLLISVYAEDPDGLSAVILAIEGGSRAQILCDSQCGTEFHDVLHAFKPAELGVLPGQLKLELWLTDSSQNQVLAAVTDVNWQPTAITGVTVSRQPGEMEVIWQASNAMRYNVYLSESGLPTASEASEQFLALDTARLITSQLPDQSSRFLWVTGVDASGESQLSEVVRVKSLENQDNQDPDVQNESYQLSEDTELEDNVLSNDSDPEQSRLSANVLSPPLHGSLTLNSDGSFRYQPNRDYSGTDSFSYQVSDGAEGVASGTATLNVLAENDPPQVQDEQYSVDEELLLVVLAPGLLGNDLDVDGDSLSVELLEGPEFGQLQLTRSGGFEYQGNAEFNGEDRFSYRVLDGQGGEGQGVVVLTVNPVNDPPQAFNDSYQMRTNSLLSVDAANGLLANDSDTEGDNLSVNRIITPVSNGQLTLAEDGSFSYEPDTDFSGLDSFTYVIADGQGGEAQASAQILVTQENQAPSVEPDRYEVEEDGRLEVSSPGVLINDSDEDRDTLRVTGVTLQADGSTTAGGVLTMEQAGGFTFVAEPNAYGTLNYVYTVADSQGLVSEGELSLTILAVNDAPSASNDSYSVDEDTSLNVQAPGLLNNDSDVDTGDSLTVNTTPTLNPSKGSVSLNSDGSFSYIPNLNASGTDSFSYQISDGNGGLASADVVLALNGVNDAPSASNDSYSVDEDTSLNVQAPGLLNNDSDVDTGDSLTVNTTPTLNPSKGSVSLNSDGSFSYTPNLNASGTDSFSYQISDGNGGLASADVVLTLNEVNDAPSASNDSYSVDEDTSLNVQAPGLLNNDNDVDSGDSLTVNTTPIASPSKGSVSLNSDGSFSYTPNLNASGTDSFSYQISDGNGGLASADVVLTLNGVNDAPSASNDSYSVDEDTSLNVQAPGLLNNDSDVDSGDSLTVNTTPIASPSKGSVSLNSDGSFSYTPNQNFNGSDSFTYEITDGNSGNGNNGNGVGGGNSSGLTAQATVTITVNAINDAPVAVTDAFSLNEGDTLSVEASGLLNNDSDVDTGDSLTVNTTPTLNPSKGNVSLNSDGSFSYTPNLNARGEDRFNYQVVDGAGGTATAEVVLTINAVNGAPVATADTYNVTEDTALTVNAPGLLSNDTDPDSGDTLSVLTTPVSGPTSGTLTLNSDGSFTYNPDSNFNGSDNFTYTVTDDAGGDTGNELSSQTTVTLTISAENDAPVVTASSVSVAENSNAGNVIGTVNASDVDSSITGYAITSGDPNGFFEIDSSGQVSLYVEATLNYEQAVQHVLTVQATDTEGATGSGTFTVNVTDVTENQTFVEQTSFTQHVEIHGEQELELYAGYAIQPVGADSDFNIITGGVQGNLIGLAKHKANGDFDTSFYNAGSGYTSHSYSFAFSQPLVDSSGNVYIVGHTTESSPRIAIVKYTSAGVLDTSFGSGGFYRISSHWAETAFDVLINSSDNFVIVGSRNDNTIQGAVLEFNPSTQATQYYLFPNAEQTTVFKQIQTDGSNYYVSGETEGSTKEWVTFKLDGSFNTDSSYGNSGSVNYAVAQNLHLNETVLFNSNLCLVGYDDSNTTLGYLGCYDANGSWLSSFNSGTPITYNFSTYDTEFKGITTDGTELFVLANYNDGSTNLPIVLNYTNSGILDSGFANSGVYSVPAIDSVQIGEDIVLSRDGELLIFGLLSNAIVNDNMLVISKLTTAGTVNTAFANQGYAFGRYGYTQDTLNSFVKLTSGKYLAAGVSIVNANSRESGFLVRFNTDGSIDGSFGRSGFINFNQSTSYNTEFKGAIELADNSIVAFGSEGDDPLAVKFSANGTIDSNWATNGIFKGSQAGVETELNGAVEASAGSIVFAGRTKPASVRRIYVLKLTAAGAFDSSFGNVPALPGEFNGQIAAAENEKVNAIAKTSSGDFIIGGYTTVSGSRNSLIFKLKSDGTALDSTFNAAGTPGYWTMSLSNTDDLVSKVFVDSSDNIFAAGKSESSSSVEQSSVFKLTSSGILDTSFNTTGYHVNNFGDSQSNFSGVVTDSQGRLIVTGWANDSSNQQDLLVVRYLVNGSLDPLFHSNGYTVVNFDAQISSAKPILVTDKDWIIGAKITNASPRLEDILMLKYVLTEN